jgi:hypothetical protein
MSILNFLFGKNLPEEKAPINVQEPATGGDEQPKENSATDAEKKENNNLIVINWGTGMPIDVIFNFIHKDFEEQGYQDALVNSDSKYRETKESIIRNDLKMLFRRITLRYQSDIRMIDVKIKNAEEAYAISSAAMMQARRETYQEHLEEISQMEQQLDNEDPKMMTMIESYRRGFLKGISAQAINFINNDNL